MHAHPVDRLATSLIWSASRRRTLGGLLAGVLAALGLAPAHETWARSRRCRTPCGECQACKQGRCARKGGRKRCRKGTCRPRTDGTACHSGGVCRDGACVCPDGLVRCGEPCVDLATDPRHCGACDTRCQLNATCNAGACQCVAGACPTDDATCCPEGSSRGVCRCTGATNPGTCETSGRLDLCPPGTLPCAGPRCGACCPAGSTCDTSTGTCLS